MMFRLMSLQQPLYSAPLHHWNSTLLSPFIRSFVENTTMAKGAAMKKAAANKDMTKGSIADSLAKSDELKKSVTTKVLNSLAELGQAEVKKTGIFTIPGLAKIKTRRKPATKASKKMMFG